MKPGSIQRIGSDRVYAVGGAVYTADVALIPQGGRLLGWSVLESSGSAAVKVALYDGHDANGQVLDLMEVSTGASKIVAFWAGGIDVQGGVFIHLISGQAQVVVWYRYDMGPA